MLAFGDEALEIRLGVADRIRPRDADDIEAMLPRGLLQLGLDVVLQKSRSA